MPDTTILAPESDALLREKLKRCSPETYKAARRFRKTRDMKVVPTVVHGVIERFVEQDLRAKLNENEDSLRLVEDLAIDSLSLFEIVMVTEDVLEITIENDDVCRLRTLGDIKRFIVAHLGDKDCAGAVQA